MADSIRQVYGETLARLGGQDPRLVVLDADVSSSTQTRFFAQAHPDRFFNLGIAEANMTATAAGLAQQGFVPFVNTFAVFISSIGLLAARSLACYGRLNVKLAGAYCGLSDAFDGASHHATEDLAILRTLPHMTVLCPSDAQSAAALTRTALETPGPCYLRLSRDVYPDLYPEGVPFAPGGGHIVREGNHVTVFACGLLVHKALEAAELLAHQGISVQVVDLYSSGPGADLPLRRSDRRGGDRGGAQRHRRPGLVRGGGAGHLRSSGPNGAGGRPGHLHRKRSVWDAAGQVRPGRGCSGRGSRAGAGQSSRNMRRSFLCWQQN